MINGNRWHQEELKCGNEQERGRKKKKPHSGSPSLNHGMVRHACAALRGYWQSPLELEMIRVMIASRFHHIAEHLASAAGSARVCARCQIPRRSSFHLFSARRAPRLAARSGSGCSAQPRGEKRKMQRTGCAVFKLVIIIITWVRLGRSSALAIDEIETSSDT